MSKDKVHRSEETAETSKEFVSPFTWEDVLQSLLRDLLTYLLHASRSNPADPKAWEAITRLDKLRQHLEKKSGAEPTRMLDPHGRKLHEDPPEEQ